MRAWEVQTISKFFCSTQQPISYCMNADAAGQHNKAQSHLKPVNSVSGGG